MPPRPYGPLWPMMIVFPFLLVLYFGVPVLPYGWITKSRIIEWLLQNR